MAEVASGVLHNVGNVMNSVNVGASVAREAVKALPVEGRHAGRRACSTRTSHRLAEYLRDRSRRPQAAGVPAQARRRARREEKRAILSNIDQLSEHLEHMKKIIAAQQSYAKVNGLTEVCTLEEIAETALAISEGALRNSKIEVVRRYEKLPPVLVDRHQIMQILVNLISNAKHALEDASTAGSRAAASRSAKVDGGVRIEVRDNGVGIAAENLPKIFSHGFTTKKTGHGFGLHNCANAAQQMDGSLTAYSDGPGKGASFVLRMPVEYAEDVPQRVGFAEAGAIAHERPAPLGQLVEPNRRILIVDDNRAIHEDFRKILGARRARRATSSNALDAELFGTARTESRRKRRFELESAYQGEEAHREGAGGRARTAAVCAAVRRRAHAARPRRHRDDGAAAARGSRGQHRHLLRVLGSQLGGNDDSVRQDRSRADLEEAVRHRRGSAARARACSGVGSSRGSHRCKVDDLTALIDAQTARAARPRTKR